MATPTPSPPTARTELHPTHYLLVTALVMLAALGVIGAWTLNAAARGRLAPVPLSGNISFDEKMEWLWKRGDRRWDVLAIGSSMTLNNLDCGEVAARLPAGVALANASSWSLKIGETRTLLDYLATVRRPRAVLLVSGPMDFYGGEKPYAITAADLDFYRATRSYSVLVARYFDPLWYYDRADQIAGQRASRAWYSSLDYDQWGGVPLEVRWPKVAPERWNERPRPERIDPRQYDELDRLATRLAEEHVALICAQPPIRDDAFDACDRAGLRAHWRRVAGILAAHGFRFINLHGQLALGRDCFADYSHLNAEGAKRFTQALLARCGDELELAPPVAGM
jgi:hypothetical protein